jgi:hypothetical protein
MTDIIKDNIRDFTEVWRQYDRSTDSGAVKNRTDSRINWGTRYRDAGYHSAQPGNLEYWGQIHQWCRDHIGEQRYCWTGSTFWFESKKDQVLFLLRWS